MRQCPDCEEKDRVVIASKIFCANCGTPWQPTDLAEEASYKQKLGMADTGSGAPAPDLVTQNNQSTSPTSTPVTNSGLTPNNTTANPPVPVVAASVSAPAPIPTPAPTIAQPVASTVEVSSPPQPIVSAAPTAETISSPQPIPAPTAVAVAPAPVSVSALPTSNSQSPPNPQPASETQASNAAVPPAPTLTSAPPVLATPIPAVELQSHIGSEIPSLDSRDESVLSDSQIKEMAAIPASTTVLSSPTGLGPASDIVAPAMPPVISDAQPVMPSTPQLVENSTPATAAPMTLSNGKVLNDVIAPPAVAAESTPTLTPAPSVDTATVAGVTMSREDALKLALGDSATSDNTSSQNLGMTHPTAVVMTVVGLALLGVFLWQANASDISVKIASLRSGLTASVPGFVPNGWGKAQSLQASNGSVSYELVKDGKTLKIEQKKSDWDSQAVLEQYVLRRSTDYLALQSQGLTIYMFGDNQAAWVNQGTFYTMSGDHGIGQDDVIRMATSL